MVEHDQETIERADYVIDLGPGGGAGGLVAAGRPRLRGTRRR
jgi:excinuclease ABC subunit A